jgi:hypothetical protein
MEVEKPQSFDFILNDILPFAIQMEIISYLNISELGTLSTVNKAMRWFCQQDSIWENCFQRRWPQASLKDHHLRKEMSNWKSIYRYQISYRLLFLRQSLDS